MLGGIQDAVKGCLKEEMRMDVISNNLANSTVVGFKKEKITFQEVLEDASTGGAGTVAKGTSPIDSALIRIKTDFTQGDSRFTGNTLDLSIQGSGFFKVDTPDGIRYTRKGNFRMDTDGFLVTQEGHNVMTAGGPINLYGAGEIHITGQGLITADGDEIGKIDVVDFKNSDVLVKVGNGYYSVTDQTLEVPQPLDTTIHQGYIELSNVNAAEEMIQMIHCLRAFESYQKAIQVLDGCNRRVINEVSRLR